MQFRVLGTPEIYDEVRQRRVPLNSPKQRVLLGVLLVRPGTVVPSEALIGELWGRNAPDKAVNALQAHVSRLRQLLIEVEPARANTPRLVARGSGYLLQARPEELDSVRFRLQAARAQRQIETDPHGASALLRQALDLWRGPALEGGSEGPLCSGAAARLEEERLQALEDLCEASLRAGRHRQIVGRLEELAASHPQRERFREQLALARRRCGRPGEARPGVEQVRRLREPRTVPAAVRTVPLRRVHEAPRRPDAAAPHPEPTPLGAADGGAGLELLRLRRRVEQLISEQDTLLSELDRLSALVEQGAAGHRESA